MLDCLQSVFSALQAERLFQIMRKFVVTIKVKDGVNWMVKLSSLRETNDKSCGTKTVKVVDFIL